MPVTSGMACSASESSAWVAVSPSGTSTTQVKALSDYVEEELGREGQEPRRIEGYAASNWILMDYQDVIVHIFDNENRLFYDLERIWRDGKSLTVEEL